MIIVVYRYMTQKLRFFSSDFDVTRKHCDFSLQSDFSFWSLQYLALRIRD